jgi:hypothetical protein
MKLFERGVYLPPCYDTDGYRFLVAINSNHQQVRKQRLFSGSLKRGGAPDAGEVEQQTIMCKRLLDMVDPLREQEAA